MRLLLSLLLLALVLPFSGCRDALVDPIDDPLTNDPPPQATSPYFKGPTEVDLGAPATFRVEYVPGATSYSWTVEDHSTGRLQGTLSADPLGLDRQFNASAVAPGVVTLFVSIKDAEGHALAGVSKRVGITP